MKLQNIVTTLAVILFSVNADARLSPAKSLNDSELKQIKNITEDFSEENHLGMSFIATGVGTYDEISDLASDNISKFLRDAKILQHSEEGDIQKVRKVKSVSMTADTIKSEVNKTFAVLQEIIDRNKKFKPELGASRDAFFGALKQKSIAWALSKGNSQASVLRTSVYIDSDACNADNDRYRSLDAEMMIYVQPEGREFLILMMGEQHD